jgi:ATP-dependent helicase HrpB
MEAAEGARPGDVRALGLDPGAVRRVGRAAAQIRRALPRLDAPFPEDREEALSSATARAFPDRVAKRRAPGSRELSLAGGGTATLAPSSVVTEAPWLVALDAVRKGTGTEVRLASAVTEEQLLELFEDRLEERRETRFDAERGRVVAVAELRYDGLVLDRAESPPEPAEAARVLAGAALDAGLRTVCDADALDRLQRRVAFARRYDDSLPALDDATVARVLARLAEGKASLAELRDADLLAWLRVELGPDGPRRLDALAPELVSIPGRARVPVTYEVGRPPWIASRLQDFFGATEGPRVAEGREPLVLHLLDPRGRAVQLTTDLGGFWDRHYEDVKKELRRRYAKHHWPDDPRTAEPRRLGRRR